MFTSEKTDNHTEKESEIALLQLFGVHQNKLCP